MFEKINSNTGFHDLAHRTLDAAKKQNTYIATAESCTGGLIMAALTDIAGSSAVIDRAFVTYTNKAKMQMLGVRAQTLREYGAVSLETAGEMAQGALQRSASQIAISVTGIAGPGGGTATKPVGTVCFGLAMKLHNHNAPIMHTETHIFQGENRATIRSATVIHSLNLLIKALET